MSRGEPPTAALTYSVMFQGLKDGLNLLVHRRSSSDKTNILFLGRHGQEEEEDTDDGPGEHDEAGLWAVVGRH